MDAFAQPRQVGTRVSRSAASPLRLAYRSDTCCVVRSEGWSLQVFYAAPTVADLDEVWEVCKAMPHPYAVVPLSLPTSKIGVSADVGARTEQMAKDTNGWLACNAHVIAGDGFFAAVVRGLVAAASLFMNEHPFKFVRTVDQAVTFTLPHLPGLASPLSAAAFQAELAEAMKLAGVEGCC